MKNRIIQKLGITVLSAAMVAQPLANSMIPVVVRVETILDDGKEVTGTITAIEGTGATLEAEDVTGGGIVINEGAVTENVGTVVQTVLHIKYYL